jgi:hypothetical protein
MMSALPPQTWLGEQLATAKPMKIYTVRYGQIDARGWPLNVCSIPVAPRSAELYLTALFSQIDRLFKPIGPFVC